MLRAKTMDCHADAGECVEDASRVHRVWRETTEMLDDENVEATGAGICKEPSEPRSPRAEGSVRRPRTGRRASYPVAVPPPRRGGGGGGQARLDHGANPRGCRWRPAPVRVRSPRTGLRPGTA